jgi:hypothetical protein
LGGGGIGFIIWALIAALGSAIIGSAIGLLFGLPAVDAKRPILISTQTTAGPNLPAGDGMGPIKAPESAGVPGNAPAAIMLRQEDRDTGYRDSTSLEQIADWLTKIIVGLTLTQFATWQTQFEALASNLTETMMGPNLHPLCHALLVGRRGANLLSTLGLPVCRPSPIPGGLIIGLFATTGFLVTYLWMRRYFILEMVIARKDEEAELKGKSARDEATNRLALARTEDALIVEERGRIAAEQQRLIEAARKTSLVEESPGRALIEDPELKKIIDDAEQRVTPGSKAREKLAEIRGKVGKELVDPDDPWRGKFGTESAEGVQLHASVYALVENPQFFRIDLCVHAESATRATQLQGTKVLYFLHPTFRDQPRTSSFGSDGTAPLELFAYGAFTVGALLEDGTALELNLATIPGAPARFLAQ